MKAIIVKDLNDAQLCILVDYLIANHYKWPISILDKESIARDEVLYMRDDKGLSCSPLLVFRRYFKNDCELVEFNKLIKMKKSDLKPGMVVEYANGEKRLIVTINNKLYLINEHVFAVVESFSEDLTCNSNHIIDIVKVYQPKEASSLNNMLQCNNCIWDRQKETVLTIQEIADKFGIPVEQLKIKK